MFPTIQMSVRGVQPPMNWKKRFCAKARKRLLHSWQNRQGAGGLMVPQDDYFARIREICDNTMFCSWPMK